MPEEKAKEKKPDVMIVEDDEFLSDLLASKFKAEGFNVEVARNGQEALDKLEEKKPRIILLDIIMPVLDGYQFLEMVNKDGTVKDVPIIALSNLGQQDEIAKAMDLGVLHFLVKANFTPDQVCSKVRAVLEG